MNQHEILAKLNGFKSNLQNIFSKKNLSSEETTENGFDGADNFIDDLPLTINPDPGINFFTCEKGATSRDVKLKMLSK